jgi:hypothetical protein
MKKAVRALTLGLIAVLSLSLTGCGLETLTGSRKVVTSTGDVNELQDDRAYVWHNEKAEDIRKDLKKPSKKDIFFLCPTGDINFKKEELSEVSEHPRSIWIGKEDDKQIPTLTSGDRLLYVAQEMPEQIVFERFADYGYTIGVSNLIDDGGGHYYIEYAGADKDTYKYSIDMESDAAALAGFENLSHLYLDQAGDVKVTEDTVSDGGTVTDLEKGKTYTCTFYTGTYYQDFRLTADVHSFGSMERFVTHDYEFLHSNCIAITIPDYFKTGYYYVNGVGLFRYVSDADAGSYNGRPYDPDIDWNDPIILYNEDGTVKYDPSRIEEFSDQGQDDPAPDTAAQDNPVEQLSNDSTDPAPQEGGTHDN